MLCYIYNNMLYTDYIERENVKYPCMLIIENPTKTTETKSYKLFTNNFHLLKVFTFYSYHSLGFRAQNIPYLFRFLKLQVVLWLTGTGTGTGVLLVLVYRDRYILTSLVTLLLHNLNIIFHASIEYHLQIVRKYRI